MGKYVLTFSALFNTIGNSSELTSISVINSFNSLSFILIKFRYSMLIKPDKT